MSAQDKTKSYYEMLSVSVAASAEEIKSAFRREIARYHPDKVEHLGPEFLEIAETRAAELTQAYRVLMDPSARAHYDGQLRDGCVDAARTARAGGPPPPSPQPAPGQVRAPDFPPDPREPSPPQHAFKQERATPDEFLRKAAVARFREAAAAALGDVEPASVRGFDAGYHARPRRSLFGKSEPAVRVLARFVSIVDAASLDETWGLVLKAAAPNGSSTSVFLMGSRLAPASELARRIADLKKRPAPRGADPVVVPLDVRDWQALVPTDAPPAVRAILGRLKNPS